ncbi:MAG: glycosyltransferase family 39 protein [Saprospiraceae bacterium]
MLTNLLANTSFRAFWRRLPIIIIIAGVLTRVAVYYQNRSLFLDEANLARNFVEKGYLEFFSPLNYEQYSPPLFSWIEKLQIQLWGVHEYALRLFPLLCSIASLYFLFQLAKQVLKSSFLIVFVLWLIAFSNWFIRYGTEVKQYSSDILLGILLPYLALREKQIPTFWWALIGIVSTWISMPSVFFLAGIGFYFLWQNARKNGRWQWTTELKKWLGVIGVWLISFAVYYFWVLRPNVNSNYLQDYHQHFFLPLLPTTFTDLVVAKDLMLSIFKTGFGYTVPAYIVGIGGTIAALFFAIRRQISIATTFILFSPILFCLLASALHFYSLIPRLTLFFIPALLLWSILGWQLLIEKITPIFKWIILGLLLLTTSIQDGYQYLFRPYQIEEIKPILHFLQQQKNDSDHLYVHHHAVPAFEFYNSQHIDNQHFKFNDNYLAHWKDRPKNYLDKKKYERTWLLFSHLISQKANDEIGGLLADFKENENLRLVKDTIGVKLYLYTKKPPIQSNE